MLFLDISPGEARLFYLGTPRNKSVRVAADA
jgi:hypothetical protein